MLLNKKTIGASLVLVGAGVALGANLRIMNRVLFSLPMGIGDITLTSSYGNCRRTTWCRCPNRI